MDEHLFDMVEDADGNKGYPYFEPFWTESGWYLRSVKTNREYSPDDFFMIVQPKEFDYFFKKYRPFLEKSRMHYMTPVFLLSWMKVILGYEALAMRERARVEYLERNLLPNLPSKQVGKVHKKSEEIYREEYNKHFSEFLEW